MHSRRSTAYFDNAVLVAYGDVDFSYASANGATFDSATMASLSYNVGFYGANLKCAALPATHAPPPRHTRCAPRSHRLKRCAAPALTCPLRARLSRRSFANFDDVTIYAYSDIYFGGIDAYNAQFNRADLFAAYGSIDFANSNVECGARPGHTPHRTRHATSRHSAPRARSPFG